MFGLIFCGMSLATLFSQSETKPTVKTAFRSESVNLLKMDRFVKANESNSNRLINKDSDLRNINTGIEIPAENYVDQPYIVITKNGNWLCVYTTGQGEEGAKGQHVVASISKDQGHTWSKPVNIEPATGPAASWVMPYITPYGRIYAFYVFNGDRISTLNGKRIRNDMLGWYCYRYSDNHGKTWSKRYRLPMRKTEVDLNNDWQGAVQIFWGIGKPIQINNSMIFAFTKIGKYMLDQGEGWFFYSENINTQKKPEKIKWTLLPDGDHGLRLPEFGSIQEEHNFVRLSNGDLYCIYRTTLGYAVNAYSQNGGRSWTTPEIATYANYQGRIKNPRACPRVWRCQNGKYLLWYHNHSGKNFNDRNPAWISGGIEKNGSIHWSQPEILFYSDDTSYESGRLSYPDLIEQDGNYWVTETQKVTARLHRVDASLFEGMWNQEKVARTAHKGLKLYQKFDKRKSRFIEMPLLPNLSQRKGFAIDLWLDFQKVRDSKKIFNSQDRQGRGVLIQKTSKQEIELRLNDGQRKLVWSSESNLIRQNKRYHIVFVLDGAARILSVIINGVLFDGGLSRQFGWSRIIPDFGDVNGAKKVFVAEEVKSIRIYDRYLKTAEVIANYQWLIKLAD